METMCTVSFINNKGEVIITSNRDEKVSRPGAIAPRNYFQSGKNIMYPKDPKAGGTWFAVDENGTVLVLLNGGIKKHDPLLLYRKSRGLIVLDLIVSRSPKDFWNEIKLQEIEPFTLVLYQNGALYELIWDGFVKVKKRLAVDESHIWSSVTLYPEEVRKERSGSFFKFLKKKEEVTASNMIDFHKNMQADDVENGLIINRENDLKTLSITQFVMRQNKGALLYYDLIGEEEFSTSFLRI